MKKYDIIYTDPPWSYRDKLNHPKMGGSAEKQYPCLSIEDLKNLPISSIASENSILFLWCTWPQIKEGLACIDAWDFTFKSVAFVWVKMNKIKKTPFYGLGRWTRGNTEFVLLATRGKPVRRDKGVSQLIHAPLTRHSAKPPETRDRILKLMGDLPRIELFAREATPGWAATGIDLDGVDMRSFLKEKIKAK